ncbi:hypothetical protein [Acidocella aromatica]|uniref:Uncharacterized protein n=1 Tax=Acidocella aromatica TaxID=1303579 RepID=A0A840VJ64_9PROT|nr:hypothetical protein [Acidocella aromatica]MBB5372299.1 hypothetical protein [Acidocella aromatica]
MDDSLISHFRRGADDRWVCKFALQLNTHDGHIQSFRVGQTVRPGDYNYDGEDLVAGLERISLTRSWRPPNPPRMLPYLI